jgi:Glycosyltransferase
MALGAARIVRKLRSERLVDIIDAHFAYPDGYAAAMTGRWLSVPVTVTLRGTEVRHAASPSIRQRLRRTFELATRLFAVSDSLRRLAIELGVPSQKVAVVGNGVDAQLFRAVPTWQARQALGIPRDARVLVTVGGLVERKGFHRVIGCLPDLQRKHADVHYLIVGSAGPEGDYLPQLKALIAALDMWDRVHFLGALPAEGVCKALSAADVFVLASRNEGWANVLLEAMACGLPVVATDVGGNAEVVSREDLGTIVPFGDQSALTKALDEALTRAWDRNSIRRYAEENDWRTRVNVLLAEFQRIQARSMAREEEAVGHG